MKHIWTFVYIKRYVNVIMMIMMMIDIIVIIIIQICNYQQVKWPL